MAANVDAMLRSAIEAYRAGKKADARALLDKVLEVDEYNENAWLWMSASVETPDEQRTCLENVLVINPNNQKARQGLKSLGFDPDAAAAAPPPPAASASPAFTDSAFGAKAPANDPSVWDDDEAPPTASSSASSASFRGSNVSSNDLDNWISGMGIGGSSGKQPSLSPTSNPFSASSFDDGADDEDDASFDDFDDRLNNMFSADEFDEDDAPAAPPARSASSASRPASAPAFSAPSIFEDDEEDDASPFDDDSSLVTDDDFDEFNALLEEDLPTLPPVRTTSSGPRISRGSDYAVMEEQVEEEDEAPDPAKLFAMIPKEVAVSSRLPGEDEDSPRTLLIGVVVMVVLNVAAIGFLVMNAM